MMIYRLALASTPPAYCPTAYKTAFAFLKKVVDREVRINLGVVSAVS
jgi:hypothetical protein